MNLTKHIPEGTPFISFKLKRMRLAVAVAVVLALWSSFASLGQGSISVADPADMADSSGDIAAIHARVIGDFLQLSMTVHGTVAPSVEQTPEGMNNRYYYHWLLDTDNNPATGRSNVEYEGNPTNLASPIGADLVVQVGWRDGKPNGIYAYDPADEDTAILTDFSYQIGGNTLSALLPMSSLGLAGGQSIAVSAFQEGASNGWQVDWVESGVLTLNGGGISTAMVSDPGGDMADSSGDITGVQAAVIGDKLHLYMTVNGWAAPKVTQTPEGMNNRYYYHWLLDTDNNPATGRSNVEYEGNPTNLANPIGSDIVVQFGWRDGKTNGVYVYDPADEDTALVTDFPFLASGNTISAVLPLSALGLANGQTIAVSAFQEGASNGWQVDWIESDTMTLSGGNISAATVSDEAGDMADRSGDITGIEAHVEGEFLSLSMTVAGVAAPRVDQTPEGMSNRYYYHWLLDTDNNPATGRSNVEYEGNPTNLQSPIGPDLVVQFGWRDGKTNGVYVYDPSDEDTAIVTDFAYQVSGNTIKALIPLDALGLAQGQTIAVSAFQEGASNGWQVDWAESDTLTLQAAASGSAAAISSLSVVDPVDMADSSGDITAISASVIGGKLHLTMTVAGVAAPRVDQTPEGMNNRYYYHWLLDTDNNPATGRSNVEYEGNPTNLQSPIGSDLVVQFGWRDGKTNGVYVYDPADEDTAIVTDFPYQVSGNTIRAALDLAALGLAAGQTIAVSAFQEGASNGWQVDWIESAVMTISGGNLPTALVSDPAGDMADSSGDITGVSASVVGGHLHLSMTVAGVAAPRVDQTPEGMNNRYYYHWLLDTDNNPATGRTNTEYEGNPTNLQSPIGSDLVVQFGWRDGKTNGVYVYDPSDEDTAILTDYPFQIGGNTITAIIPMSAIGLAPGQTVAVSAFQEGSSNGWQVDWVESDVITLNGGNVPAVVVGDPAGDMADSSGDITYVGAELVGNQLQLFMTVAGVAAPRTDQTPEGMNNRYYYHWLLDTDNNPATGRSNVEYEGNPTNLQSPIGSDLVVQFGWRDGKTNGVYVYDPSDEDTAIATDFPFVASGNTIVAMLDLDVLGLAVGQTIAVSAFQEGASNGWQVDWVESAVMTLTQGGATGIDVETNFNGNGFGFTLTLTDDGDNIVDPQSITASMDGMEIQLTVNKADGVTIVKGRNPHLLEVGTANTLTVTARVGGKSQSEDFVINVQPYTTLPGDSRGGMDPNAEPGFMANITMVSSWQSGNSSIHENKADLAEKQLVGGFQDPNLGIFFYNEATYNFDAWEVEPIAVEGTINWFELAPDFDALINFPNDEPFPAFAELGVFFLQGLVIELKTYLELEAGYHQFGLFSEGGHKVTATHSPDGPLLSLYDNSENPERVPTYFARSQIFDVVAERDGLYPIRILWFQGDARQEEGMMLEFYSVKDRKLHLVNDASNPDSVMAYQSASEIQYTTPEISLSRQGNSVMLEWTGMLQTADNPEGPWTDVADDSQSPMTWTTTGSHKFARCRAF